MAIGATAKMLTREVLSGHTRESLDFTAIEREALARDLRALINKVFWIIAKAAGEEPDEVRDKEIWRWERNMGEDPNELLVASLIAHDYLREKITGPLSEMTLAVLVGTLAAQLSLLSDNPTQLLEIL